MLPGWAAISGAIYAAVPAGVWIYLLAGRGDFWRVLDEAHCLEAPALRRRVTAVIPARDEAALIGQSVASLLAQRYAGDLTIFVVDDNSSDQTAEVARATADRAGMSERLAVFPAGPLPEGWTGKLWALSEGVRRASMVRPDYFLLTDADIVHASDTVSQLVARAETGPFDLVSFMAKLRCRSFAEQSLIPAFVYFFLNLYPPIWIARADRATAGAAGGCILMRRDMLSQIGGLQTIRGELIDDCALAREVKRRGGRVWLGLTSTTHSIREYGTFAEIEKMISRTAYTQLGYSPLLLAGTVAVLATVFVLPPCLVVNGDRIAVAMGLLAWALMSISFVPMLRFYGRSPAWAVALPAIAVFYMAATLHSAWLHYRRLGGAWKGRVAARRSLE